MTPSVEHSERRIFGKYTLIAKLATGGMGEICVARLRGVAGFEKLVVIKRVLPHLAENGKYIAMLQDEARIAARLSHQNVCQVLDLGQADGEYYIAMEYLEGVVMSDLVRRRSGQEERLDPRLVAEIVIQACKGLDAAHGLRDRDGALLNLVHRDISPSNLFVTTAGLVKVLDFGIAKAPGMPGTTQTGVVKGKWAYMSPEQVLRRPLDRRSDLFALGVVLHEGLTGRRLFRRPSEYEICRAITESDAPSVRESRPELPEALAEVVARALARDPDQRFATAAEMGRALYQAMASLGGPASLSELAEFITSRFHAEIQERRRFIDSVEIKEEAALAAAVGPLPVAPSPFSPGTGDSRQPSSSARRERSSDEEATADTRSMVRLPEAPVPVEQAQSGPPITPAPSGPAPRSRAGVAVVVAAAIVAVAGGAVAYLTTRPDPDMGVAAMVVSDGSAVLESEAIAVMDAGLDAAAGDAAPAPATDAGEPEQKPERVSGSDRPARSKRYDQGHYTRVFKRGQRRLLGCFSEHADGVDGLPMIAIDLRIDVSGAVSAASIQPPELTATPLGGCLVRVARTMTFGPHDQPVEVTIPLGVRSH